MALETLDEVGYLTKEIILKDFMPYFESITQKKVEFRGCLDPKASIHVKNILKQLKNGLAYKHYGH